MRFPALSTGVLLRDRAITSKDAHLRRRHAALRWALERTFDLFNNVLSLHY